HQRRASSSGGGGGVGDPEESSGPFSWLQSAVSPRSRPHGGWGTTGGGGGGGSRVSGGKSVSPPRERGGFELAAFPLSPFGNLSNSNKNNRAGGDSGGGKGTAAALSFPSSPAHLYPGAGSSGAPTEETGD
ncbi:unnamed protein product, partial [Scytosiphon promiscuus]